MDGITDTDAIGEFLLGIQDSLERMACGSQS